MLQYKIEVWQKLIPWEKKKERKKTIHKILSDKQLITWTHSQAVITYSGTNVLVVRQGPPTVNSNRNLIHFHLWQLKWPNMDCSSGNCQVKRVNTWGGLRLWQKVYFLMFPHYHYLVQIKSIVSHNQTLRLHFSDAGIIGEWETFC